MAYSSFCSTWTVLLHLHCEPVLHLDVSRAFYAPRVSFYKSLVSLVKKCLCGTCACLSTGLCAAPGPVCLQEPVLYLRMSVYKSFVLHLDVSVYKSPAQAVAVGIKSKQFFLFLRFVSKQVLYVFFRLFQYMLETLKQTEANQKNIFFSFVNKTEK
jgi:hypothetical protein